jgi:hypothetical protein
MGIDWCGLEAILLAEQCCLQKKKVLTLGRQSINLSLSKVNELLNRYKQNEIDDAGVYSEKLFSHLGFTITDSIDASSYEEATIIHNLNKSITEKNYGQYSFIFDGGTSEHIFNAPQVFKNVIDMLDIGGIFVSVVPNNNFSGHGMYQFSPEFFLSIFCEKYGFKIKHLYLVKNDSDAYNGINVNGYTNCKENGRNNAKFDGNDQVYIVLVTEKISIGSNLLEDPPNQFSYENFDWIR